MNYNEAYTCSSISSFMYFKTDQFAQIFFSVNFTLTLQETRSIHDSMNRPTIEFIAYIYILL